MVCSLFYLPKYLSMSSMGREMTSLKHFSSSPCNSLARRQRQASWPWSMMVPSDRELEDMVGDNDCDCHPYSAIFGRIVLYVLRTASTAASRTRLTFSLRAGQSLDPPTSSSRSLNRAT